MQKKGIFKNQNPQLVVGVGASVGDLNALKIFVKNITTDFDITYVLVQHLDRTPKSLLPQLLQGYAAIPVVEIENEMTYESNIMYVLPSNQRLFIEGNVFKLVSRKEQVCSQVSLLNDFFESLAKSYKNKAVGIVFSGTGNDSAYGLGILKENGGITIAQDPASSNSKGIHTNAYLSKKIDYVVKPEDMLNTIRMAMNKLQKELFDSKSINKTDIQISAENLLLKDYTPATVVVNQNLDLIHTNGKVVNYLKQPLGGSNKSLLKLAKGGLGYDVKQLVNRAVKTGKVQHNKNVLINFDDKRHQISIKVIPILGIEGSHYLVIFKKNKKLKRDSQFNSSIVASTETKKDLRIKELEEALLHAKEELMQMTEEQAMVTEELQSANEELMSGTEELQILNEELKSSKEALQRTVQEITVTNHKLTALNKKVFKEKQFSEAIVKTMRHPLLVLDKEYNVIMASDVFYEHFKISKEKILGKSINDQKHELWDASALKELLETSLSNQESFKNYKIVHDIKTIGERTLLLNGQKVLSNKGEDETILLVFEDITERNLAENQSIESIYQYNEFIESSPWLIAILKGENLQLELANPAMLEVLGKGKNIIGTPYAEAVPELVTQGFIAILEKVYKTGEPYEAFKVPATLKKNGKDELNYYDFIYQPQHNIKGDIVGVSIIATIVTDQVELYNKLEESEKKFNQLSDQLPDLINLSDHEGKVFYYNQSWLNFTGLTLDELKNRNWELTIHPDDLEEVKEKFDHSLRHNTDFNMELRILNRHGEYCWFLSRALPITNADGEVIWIGSNVLIQNLKEDEKRKENFLKLVSHELKTPVTSIKGYVQLLLSMIETTNSRNIDAFPLVPSLKRIDTQISRLTVLIAEMLDLSRMEDSKLVLQKKEFDLNELVIRTVEDIEHSTGFSNIKLTLPSTETIVHADADRIGQVLINFITNALKYTTTNKKVDIKLMQSDTHTIAVSVRDYGIGIAKGDQEKIFNKFYRVSSKNEATYAGFGIGLFIAKQIMERHGGSVEVKSELGEGATFTFLLPIKN
ncbi:chemotaxis protein CheB [Aquimarina sp. W85]|uniref:chemotaxis protein CheB n=1 Tax=Aquimarina rhodophyticola TaxID=3342246 RepID=UPI00366B031C